jgi:hypothetical protein
MAVLETAKVNFEINFGMEDDSLIGTCTWAPQCAFCLERPGGIGLHGHVQCPLVGTINKIRQQGELKPLTFSEGVLTREDEKVDLDVTKEVRAMKVAFALLQDRISKLEAAGSKVPGPNPAGAPGQGKKRKPDDAANPQRGGPAKRGRGGGQGGQGRPPASGQQGGQQGQGGKGKGKGMHRPIEEREANCPLAPAGGPGPASAWN